MLKVYDQYKNPLGYIAKYADLRIESTLSTGDKELQFTYMESSKPRRIAAEYYIETQDDFFVVKEVSVTSGSYPEIICKLDLEGLTSDTFSEFTVDNGTLQSAVSTALSGTGWTYSIDSAVASKKRTYDTAQWKTPYEILQSLMEIWMCEMRFDTKNRIVYIAEELGEDRGVYFEKSLNLEQLKLTSDTNDYYTRIIPIGEDDLRITSVNDGVEYVENYQYSNKIRTLVWENTNYDDAETLKEDAEKKLEEISKPAKSYSADLVDLAKESKKYSILEFSLGDTITLLDEETGIKDKQRIVKLTEYPQDPRQNTCELSNTVASFVELTSEMRIVSDTVSNITDSSGSVDGSSVKYIVQGTVVNGVTGIEVIIEGSDALAKAIELSEEYTNTTLTSYSTTSEMNTAIETSYDEIKLFVTSNYSTTETVYSNISDAITTAEGYAESYTDTKLTSYSTTSQMNSAIEIAQDSILLTVSNTYTTQSDTAEYIESAISTAEGYAESYTSTQLESYSTTEEMNSAIDQKADSILLSVSQTYATTSSVESQVSSAISTAEGYAESYTSTQLESYSTTTEMNSAIKTATDSINLSVSQTYATTSSVETQVSSAITTAEGYAESYTNTQLTSYSTTTEMKSYVDLAVDSIDLTVYAKTTEVTSAVSTCESYADGVASTAKEEAETYAESYVAASLVLKIVDGVGVISENADRIELTAGELVITSGNLIVDESGNVTVAGDVRATSLSLGDAVFSLERTTITTPVVSSGGGVTSSAYTADALTLTTTNYFGFIVDILQADSLNASGAYVENLSAGAIKASGYIYSQGETVVYGSWVGDSSTPVYVDAWGEVQECNYSLTPLGYLNYKSTGTLEISPTLVSMVSTCVWGDLAVDGDISCTGAYPSDERLKYDWIDLDAYDGFFDNLKPGGFRYTYEPEKRHFGMGAQSVEKALTDNGLTIEDFSAGLQIRNVSEDSPLYHGLSEEYKLNYTEFVPLLIYQVQQLKTRCTLLEGYVETLLTMQGIA